MSKQYFTDEFKIEAVKQITELGYSTSEVASRLCVSAHSLYAWKKRFGKTAIQRTQAAGATDFMYLVPNPPNGKPIYR